MTTEPLEALDLLGPERHASVAEAIARYGGKARNLGLLVQRGFDVPGGFCITTTAFGEVVDGLPLFGAPEQIRARIAGAEIPARLRADIEGRYLALGADAVAVRSSATAEDLDDASFAGQQDTFLHVIGLEAVLDAVRRCWASAWTDRAVSYRLDRGIADSQVAVAVVVQRMVAADVAGVMFTANPITGTRHRTVLEANPGLGESVVSGSVDPDHWVVNSETGAVLEQRIGTKQNRVRGRAGGGTEVVDHAVAGACLTRDQVTELARLGARVERSFGGPQDIEWALDANGRVWLTQTRAITTLFPLLGGPEDGFGVYVCLSLAQGLVRPITPMGRCQMRLIGSCVARLAGQPVDHPANGPAGLKFAAGRPFVNLTRPLSNRWSRRLVLAFASVMEARLVPVIERLVEDAPSLATPTRSPLPVARIVAPIFLRVALPQQVITAAVSPRFAHRRLDRVEDELRGLRLAADVLPERRLDLVEQYLAERAILLMPGNIGYAAAGFAFLALAKTLLGQTGRGHLHTVLRALPHNVTTEMDLDLWRLSRAVAGDPASARAFAERPDVADLLPSWRAGHLPPIAQRGLDAFLDRHGYRGVAEIDLGMPRWSEDPSHVLGLITNYLRLDASHDPARQFGRRAEEAEEEITDLCRQLRARSRIGALTAGLAGFALRRARVLAGLRERPKALLVLSLTAMRRELLVVADELVTRGSMDQPADLFMITIGDARRGLAGADLRALVAANREEYRRELCRRRIPRLLLADGTEPESLNTGTATDGGLRGSPASSGVVTAKARVILDPVGARLEQGEILIAPSTDPGWTPLFLIAGGLVMEMGGSNSHGAVVAREYGIPAVVGVREATSRIRTGDVITLDGASGTITTPASSPPGTART